MDSYKYNIGVFITRIVQVISLCNGISYYVTHGNEMMVIRIMLACLIISWTHPCSRTSWPCHTQLPLHCNTCLHYLFIVRLFYMITFTIGAVVQYEMFANIQLNTCSYTLCTIEIQVEGTDGLKHLQATACSLLPSSQYKENPKIICIWALSS